MAEVHVGKGGGKRRRAVVIPPMKAGLRIALSLVGTLLTAIIAFFFMMPAINFRAPEFYGYLLIVVVSFVVLLYLLSNAAKQAEFMPWVKRTAMPAIAIALVIALFFGAAWVFSSPFFLSRRYHNIMGEYLQTLTFVEGVDEVDFERLPKIDEAAARMLAEATLGELIEVVSQFELSRNSTQIVYNGRPVRVFPLAYVDAVRWIRNTSTGLPGFVMVYMDTQESEFHFLEQNMRYTDEEHFFRLLQRHLRLHFPTYLLGTASFQIDGQRNPYWVVPRMNRTVGLVGGEDVIGVLLVNAVTGDIVEYTLEDVPEWVDRVFSATLLRQQFSWFGLYGSGFWNSILGQQGVWQATPDYNYLIQRNDVYMYSGVSAAGGGENSIIGFILVNQRTRETHFYQIAGAAETFARQAAQGAVQAQRWRATHPLLINVSDHATYFMALKDDNNIVQGFAMANVAQFNLINVWAETLDETIERYVAALAAHGLDVNPGSNYAITPNMTSGAISSIRQVMIGGTTNLLIRLQGDSAYYRMAVSDSNVYLALLNVGDVITITSAMDAEITGNVIPATSIALGAVVLEPPVDVEDYDYTAQLNNGNDAIDADTQPEE
ncbi:MAG: hypothetical protein FWD06_08845 [Oscillospiraceae bacterium]|nr:hypothetical protein [Oscillospiraceae bacterium]